MNAEVIIAGLAGGYALGSMIEAEERAARRASDLGGRMARPGLGQNGNGNGNGTPATPGGMAPGSGPGAPARGGRDISVFSPFSFGRFGYPWWGGYGYPWAYQQPYQYPYPPCPQYPYGVPAPAYPALRTGVPLY